MTQNPIPFNEGSIEFLTGYLLGVGKLQVNPKKYTSSSGSSIVLFSDPLQLIFTSEDPRSLKPLGLMTGLSIEWQSGPLSFYSVTLTDKQWIKFVIHEWICTLRCCEEIDTAYDVFEEFPELLTASEILKSV